MSNMANNLEITREMKGSGIEWIGEIPNDWENIRVKNKFKSVKRIVGNKVDEYDRLALTLNGVIKRSKEDSEGLQPEKFEGYQILKENELVFKLIDLENLRTSRVGLSPYVGLVSPAYIALTNNSKDNRFSYYYFMSLYYRAIFNSLGGDGVRSALNKVDLLNIPFICPPLNEQQAIANYLDEQVGKIDELIAEQKTAIENWKAYKQSLITEIVTKGLNPNVEMKDSGIEWIGLIPKEWEVRKLDSISKTITDFVASGSFAALRENVEYKDEPDYAMLVRTVDLSNNFNNSNIYITKKSYEFLSNSNLYGGELILSNIGSVGNVYYFQPKYKRNSLASNSIMVITNYCNKFYYYWFLSPLGNQSLINLSNSAVQMKFNKTQLRALRVPLPPFHEQQAIANYLDEKCSKIDQTIEQKQALIKQLEEYKQSLIYECVTGKRCVL